MRARRYARRNGACALRCDAGGTGTVVDGGVDGLIVEGITCLRNTWEEACMGIETGVEEKGCGRAECLCEAGFERYVGLVVDEEAGAA
jgi:hypothetical protein